MKTKSILSPFLAPCILLGLCAPLFSQQPAPDLRIVASEGVFTLDGATVLEHFGASRLDPAGLELHHLGKLVPFEAVLGEDGKLDPGDRILFHSPGGSSFHSRKTTFFLKRGKGGIHHVRQPSPGKGAEEGARDWVWTTSEIEIDRSRTTFRGHLFPIDADLEWWYWLGVSAGRSRALKIQIPHRISEGDIDLRVELVGEARGSDEAHAMVGLNGKGVKPVSLAAGQRRTVPLEVDTASLEDGVFTLGLESTDVDGTRAVWLDRMILEYRMVPRLREGFLPFQVRQGDPQGPIHLGGVSSLVHLWDLERGKCWHLIPQLAGDAVSGMAILPDLPPGKYIAFEATHPRVPVDTCPRRGGDLRSPSEGADYIAIVPDAFLPALAPLVDHRRSQGYRVRVISPEAIYDAFGHGEFSPGAIRRFLVHAWKHWPSPAPRFLLLAADATYDVDWFGDDVIPTGFVHTALSGETASDHIYADLDGDTLPDLAVGRFPARTSDELSHLVARTLLYETSHLPGAWRKKITMIAGEGRFGGAADALIEQLFNRLVTEFIPDEYDIHVTYASPTSPYLCVPTALGDRVIDKLNEGSLFFIYIGHGSATGFDELRYDGRSYPILESPSLPRIDVTHGMPIVLTLACSNAHFDDPRTLSIAEGLLARPRGPIAFIGSSRVSHPYPMGLIGKGMIDVLLDEGQLTTLGEVLQEAKKRLIVPPKGDSLRRFIDFSAAMSMKDGPPPARIREDHLHLFHLLGDPALKIGKPHHKVDLVAPGTPINAGDTIKLAGLVQGLTTGTITLTLETMRNVILEPLESVDPGTPGATDRIERNYQRANRKVCISLDKKFTINPFLQTLQIPGSLPPDTYILKVFVEGVEGTAFGATRIQVRSP